jgi:hypothetical protein
MATQRWLKKRHEELVKQEQMTWTSIYRKLDNSLLRPNPLVTNEKLNAMGLPERS